ncbi:MAG TPA: tRNA (adenosine(37)-N6)-threonylcarbamoyltransferase complex dimerization subunit type 1 TsaB, partial [Bacteroidia bacterium]|nr:tRNA (adenosine(37)-N6)-threonylcarbamoyltransferase complex dimerization subunit type 1 TsaB [Bacteroidia bacterium]
KNLNEGSPQTDSKVRILAIETATDVSSVALFEDGNLVSLQENHSNRTHARLVTVMIERLLQDMELKASDLDAVCVARGPGSYTGLRVGVSVAKGLCMALDIPLLSVGSLEALAWSVADIARHLDAWICPMIDARRMEVFCQLHDSQLQAQGEPIALIVEEGAFQEELARQKILFLGDGAAKCGPILSANPNALVLGDRISSAAFMGKAAQAKFISGNHEDLITFEPFYLKEFVATLSRKKIL